MNKILIPIIIIIALSFILISFLIPKYECVSNAKEEFIVSKSFNEMRQFVIFGGFAQEIAKSNNAKIISQETKDSNFRIFKPFATDRDWEGQHKSLLKISICAPNHGFIEVNMLQTITIGKNNIQIISELDKPLSVGVTELKQEIIILPKNNNCHVSVNCYIKLKRRLPFFIKEYAKKQIEQTTQDSVKSLKNILENPKKGILIPL